MDIEKLEKSIGYEFKNKDLLKRALTHVSFANENNVKSFQVIVFQNLYLVNIYMEILKNYQKENLQR